MIQRIQSIYFLISIICIGITSSGISIFSFESDLASYRFTSYGLEKFDQADKLMEFNAYPYYASFIALILVLIFALFSYKNLKRQLTLGRIILLVYLVVIAGIVLLSFFGHVLTGEKEVVRTYDPGFYIFIAGFPFILLANLGVKRDKNLLDSVNRLR